MDQRIVIGCVVMGATLGRIGRVWSIDANDRVRVIWDDDRAKQMWWVESSEVRFVCAGRFGGCAYAREHAADRVLMLRIGKQRIDANYKRLQRIEQYLRETVNA